MLAQIVRQQAMLDLVNRPLSVVRDLLEAYPDQEGTANMVTDNTCFAPLTASQSGHVFALAVKLLNLPLPATHRLRGQGRILSDIVSDDIVRALGGKHDREKVHLMRCGKVLNLHDLEGHGGKRTWNEVKSG